MTLVWLEIFKHQVGFLLMPTTDIDVGPGAVGGGLAVFGAVLEVLNPDRKLGLSKECSSHRQNPAWLKNLRE